MRAKWRKYYLFICTIIIVVFSFLGSLAFLRTNLLQRQEKYEFESIYKNTSIDFIIPSPSYEQVFELQNDSTGIERIVPFYETTTEVKSDGKICVGKTQIFNTVEWLDITPYGSERMVHRFSNVQPGTAIVDKKFATMNNCMEGSVLEIQIREKAYKFNVVGIAENNPYINEGSVAMFLTEEAISEFMDVGIKYSAAYVKATDIVKCKIFLLNEYKPLGRLKEEEGFSSEDSYKEHLNNFYEADWSKEITICSENYEVLSVKYQNVNKNCRKNIFTYSGICLIFFIVINSAMLKSDNMTSYMKDYIIKGNGKKEDIVRFYEHGIWWNSCIFCIMNLICFAFWAYGMKREIWSMQIREIVLVSVTVILVSAIMSLVTKKYVKRHYVFKGWK